MLALFAAVIIAGGIWGEAFLRLSFKARMLIAVPITAAFWAWILLSHFA
jgi:ABC-type sugar transport system permease subunit